MSILRQIVTHPAVLVGLGGGVGSVARYYVGRLLDPTATAGRLPWGTFAVNVAGSFLVALLALLLLERARPEQRALYLLLGTGFCGGFTTFSAFEWETYRLLRDGAWGVAGLYVGSSIAAGLAGVLAATALVRLLFGPAATV